MSTAKPKHSEFLHHLTSLIDEKGVRAGLIYLNGLTAHRFSALYLFDKEMLVNLYFFDRENPKQWSTPDIPVLASYCVFVRSSGNTFTVADSLQDDRVRTHQKCKVVQSYCGVPLLDEQGNMFGTICHFDLRPIPITPENVRLLESVAPLIKRSQLIEPESTEQ